jgi:predicted ATP-grasp superfamily ATP-dependent carboligase
VASLAVCEPNALLKQRACEFMKAVGYSGMVDIDFRFDARDGKYKVLDVNPRIGSTFRLFVSSEGIDVARAAYLDMTGQPLPPSHTPNGRKWVVEDLDLVTSLRYWRDGKLNAREWLRSLRGIDEYSFLSLDDPLPLLAMLRADLSELRYRIRPPADALPPFTPKFPAKAAERSYPG